MKKIQVIKNACALLGVAVLLFTSNANAGIAYGDTGTVTMSANGRVFTASSPELGTFQTFCLERDEFFSSGSTYNYVINSGAVNGGMGGPNPDPISRGTAFIYSQFRAGVAGYTNTGEVQDAIWWLENEFADKPDGLSLLGSAMNVLNAALAVLYPTSVSRSDLRTDAALYEFGVVALNLTDDQGVRKQDVLAQVPEPSTVVAGALLLLPFGVSTLRILRKNKQA
jgi:hypothetical protein